MVTTISRPGPAPGVFIGIDWGGREHQLCAVDASGDVVGKARVEHTVAGMAVIDDFITTTGATTPVVCAIERGEGLLVEHIQAAGVPLFCISPKISSRARERYRLANTKSHMACLDHKHKSHSLGLCVAGEYIRGLAFGTRNLTNTSP